MCIPELIIVWDKEIIQYWEQMYNPSGKKHWRNKMQVTVSVIILKKSYILTSGSNHYPCLFLINSGLSKTQKHTSIHSLYKNSPHKRAYWFESEKKWIFILQCCLQHLKKAPSTTFQALAYETVLTQQGIY